MTTVLWFESWQFAFCIFHFAFCIVPKAPPLPLSVRKLRPMLKNQIPRLLHSLDCRYAGAFPFDRNRTGIVHFLEDVEQLAVIGVGSFAIGLEAGELRVR